LLALTGCLLSLRHHTLRHGVNNEQNSIRHFQYEYGWLSGLAGTRHWPQRIVIGCHYNATRIVSRVITGWSINVG